jgi:hypothetical protein
MRRLAVAVVVVVVLACLAVGVANADTVTLKKATDPGITYAETWDTKVTNYSSTEAVYNFGSDFKYDEYHHWNLYSTSRAMLVKFDLTAIPQVDKVEGVNSATLRLYQLGWSYSNNNKQVAQIAEDWVEGSSKGEWNHVCDGAQYYARNAGNVVTPQYDAGEDLYKVENVADLAVDPVDNSRWFVRHSGNNWNMANRAYTKYDTLADLKTAGAGRNSYYDAANDILWVQDSTELRWFGDPDMFDTPGAGITGSAITDMTDPQPDPSGWIEFDVATIVENWLVNGQDNYGFKFMLPGGNQLDMATSEYSADEGLRPELVLDLEIAQPIAEPAGLSLLGLALLGLRKKRS